jgi:ribosome recycling factor
MAYSFSDVTIKFDKSLDHVKADLAPLRTGRATVQLLDPVVVEVYGSQMKVHEVATVAAPDPTTLTVTPWDRSILEALEKAISSSGLNLSPVVSQGMIRISIPPLTQERRLELVKLLHQKIEQGRVLLRNVRLDAKKEIESQKGQEDISEDDIKSDVAELETLLKKYMDQLDSIAAEKEKELMTV